MNLDFICIGANKSGTTWLYSMLKQHVELNLANVKEPHYFSEFYGKGIDWYKKCWEEGNGMKGEFSTSYYNDKEALVKIKAAFPRVKIIIVLRDPFERSLSHLMHLLRKEPVSDIKAYLSKNSEIIDNSMYSIYLNWLSEIFSKNQVLVLQFEQMVNKPEDFLRKVYSFLCVNERFIPENIFDKVGAGFAPRSVLLEKIRSWSFFFLKKLGGYKLINYLKEKKIYRWFKRLNDVGVDEYKEKKSRAEHALKLYLPAFKDDCLRIKKNNLSEQLNFEIWKTCLNN